MSRIPLLDRALRLLITSAAAGLLVGTLSSGSCYYRSCSGSHCNEKEHEHHTVSIRGYRAERVSGFSTTLVLRDIRGPVLPGGGEAEGEEIASFGARVLTENAELLGIPAGALAGLVDVRSGASGPRARHVLSGAALTLELELHYRADGRLDTIVRHTAASPLDAVLGR